MDLPDPDGPTSAVTSPSRAVNVTPESTCSPVLYENDTSSNARSWPCGANEVAPVMGRSAASAFVRLMEWRISASSAVDCSTTFTGSYTRVTTSKNAKYVMKSTWPATISPAPAKTVDAMPSFRNAWDEEMVAPVASSEATMRRSISSSLPPRPPRNASDWLVARISCAQSRNSCTPSAITRRWRSLASTLRRTSPIRSPMNANATGTGQNAASPSRQSNASTHTTATAVDIPVPNSCGTTCMNKRS